MTFFTWGAMIVLKSVKAPGSFFSVVKYTNNILVML